jgi:hypothetical protein
MANSDQGQGGGRPSAPVTPAGAGAGAETAPCVVCGDPDAQELEKSREVLDRVAGLLRQPHAGTLAAIAKVLSDTGRGAATGEDDGPGDLDGPAARMVLPSQVWVLEYLHKHGSDLSAHATEEDAQRAIAEIARNFWEDVASWHPDMPATPDGLSDEDATRIYFANYDAEEHRLHCLGVRSLDVAPLQMRAPEIAELLALLPRGGWGAEELGTLANWLTSHDYNVGDAGGANSQDDEPTGYEGFVCRADDSVISVQCSEDRCRECPDDAGRGEGPSGGGPLKGDYCAHGCGLCGTGRERPGGR